MQITLGNRELAVIALMVIVATIFAGIFHDQSIKGIYGSLTPTIYHDKAQLGDQNATISDLQNQVSSLKAQLAGSQEASLKGDFSYGSNSGCGYYTDCQYYICGAYANVGSNTAINSKVSFAFYSQPGLTGQVLCSTEDILGNVSGGSVQLLPASVTCNSSSTVQAQSFSYQLSYS